jgi:hypothetical protein
METVFPVRVSNAAASASPGLKPPAAATVALAAVCKNSRRVNFIIKALLFSL